MNAPLDLGDTVERFDHVAVAVRDIRGTLSLVSLLNGKFRDGGESTRGNFHWVQFDLPGVGKLELITPSTSADSTNFLVRFLERNGEGLHHVTMKVTDLEEAIAAAKGLGLKVVGVDKSDPAWQEAFVHPRSANGVLVQIAQWRDAPAPPQTLDAFLITVAS
jgi:methylmalonyl-CoA/ethylmalonyl-CoA epimerase